MPKLSSSNGFEDLDCAMSNNSTLSFTVYHCLFVCLKCEMFFPYLCRLSNCSIGEEGCAVLVAALLSNPTHLREFDLSWNKPQDSAVILLSDILKDPLCKLVKLKWDLYIKNPYYINCVTSMTNHQILLKDYPTIISTFYPIAWYCIALPLNIENDVRHEYVQIGNTHTHCIQNLIFSEIFNEDFQWINYASVQ